MADSPVFNTPSNTTGDSSRFNVMSIVAFVFAFVFSPVGIILGIIALVQIRRTGQRGHGLALAAVILGVVFLLIGIIVDATVLPHLVSSTAGV